MWISQMAQELVRGMPNLLVANMYGMVAFKINTFYGSLFKGTPNKSNFEILESFLPRLLPWMFSHLQNKVGNEF